MTDKRTKTKDPGYRLGTRSMANLKDVHPDLVLIVKDAIRITEQDFAVFEGVRSKEKAKENVKNGVSWTANSKHCVQADGFGHAIDLVPYIDGELKWDWDGCYKVAEAMRTAAKKRGKHLRWGGFWGRLTVTVLSPRTLVAEYIRRKKARGETPHPDGPHFEITKVS
jgi:peptidoglycan L-alanyl-D-glutamate endopeptidase CwlK